APSGGTQVPPLQRNVRAAPLCPAPLRGQRLHGCAGQPFAEGGLMGKRKGTNGAGPLPSGRIPRPDLLPVDPATNRPLPPREQPGYYPGFSTLGQQNFWDEATRKVVLTRVHEVPPIRF